MVVAGTSSPAPLFLRKRSGMLRRDNLSKRYGDYPIFQGLTHRLTLGCVALCEEDSGLLRGRSHDRSPRGGVDFLASDARERRGGGVAIF
ncbi:hypothetical protein D9M70_631300 [compost metagenome]